MAGNRPSAAPKHEKSRLAAGRVCRGLSDDEIRKIVGGNCRAYAELALDKHPWGPLI